MLLILLWRTGNFVLDLSRWNHVNFSFPLCRCLDSECDSFCYVSRLNLLFSFGLFLVFWIFFWNCERAHDKVRCIHIAFCENVSLHLSLLPSPMKFKLLYSTLLHFIFFFLYFSLEYTIFASYSFGILLWPCRNSKPLRFLSA